MKKRVKFMITAFRDGFQSVFGARVLTKDFLPAFEAALEAGLDHYEVGGGARFQSPYFYCNEDAFDMMAKLREVAGPDVKLQSLARGVNVVGLDSQSRDIIKLHAELFHKHGISHIRNFDALNDVNNLDYSGHCIHDSGAKHEVCVTLMALPPGTTGSHDSEFYIGRLKHILDAGIPYDTICFKDASGTATPATVYETIKKAREMVGDDAYLVYHTHETAGISIRCYTAAIEAGVTQVDLSMSPVSGGTCQPDILTMWHALRGTDYDLGIDVEKVMKAEEKFEECMADYFKPPESMSVSPMIPFSPMPGGALTANTQMMRDNDLMDRYNEVAAAMGEAVERGGVGTSVTPGSQFYFQQAFNNVMVGPWKKIAEGYGKMVLGYFGETPIDPDPEIIKLAQEQLGLEPTKEKVVDINDKDPSKGIEVAKKMLQDADLPISDENIFIAATCKDKGIQFLKGEARVNIRKVEKKSEEAAASEGGAPSGYMVTLNGKNYAVKLEGDTAIVNGVSYNVQVAEDSGEAGPAAASGTVQDVKAPMPGLVLRIETSVGTQVAEGDLLMVMEAMKMETEIHSPVSGTVQEIMVSQGDQKKAGDVLLTIG